MEPSLLSAASAELAAAYLQLVVTLGSQRRELTFEVVYAFL